MTPEIDGLLPLEIFTVKSFRCLMLIEFFDVGSGSKFINDFRKTVIRLCCGLCCSLLPNNDSSLGGTLVLLGLSKLGY